MIFSLTNGIRTPNDELKDILRINREMIQKEGIIYIPDMYHITTHEFDEALYKDGGKCGSNLTELFKKKIYPLVENPEYRRKQFIFYNNLKIFWRLQPLLFEALLAFFEKKYILTYMALTPVVEGLLLRWAKKEKTVEIFKFKEFMKEKTNEMIQKYPNDIWCQCNFKLLSFIVSDFFFERSKNRPECINTMFNRNAVCHLLNDPQYIQSKQNSLRLFTIIDLIAHCYSYDHSQ